MANPPPLTSTPCQRNHDIRHSPQFRPGSSNAHLPHLAQIPRLARCPLCHLHAYLGPQRVATNTHYPRKLAYLLGGATRQSPIPGPTKGGFCHMIFLGEEEDDDADCFWVVQLLRLHKFHFASIHHRLGLS